MTYTQVSPKYQIVIPKEVRTKLSLKPKQRLIVMAKGGIIHLVPVVPLRQMRGAFGKTSLNTKNLRDKRDRL